MEKQLFSSLNKLITPEIISKVSSDLGENSGKVTSAIGAIIPSIFGSLVNKGEDSNVENVLKQAGNSSILSNITELFSGKTNPETQNIGSSFLNTLFGYKINSFSGIISSFSGLTSDNANKIIGMVSPLVAGFLGKKMLSGVSLKSILEQISSEKDNFLSSIPSGLTSVLGISSLAGLGSSFLNKTESQTKEAVDHMKNKVEDTYEDYKAKLNKKSGSGWIKWLIGILVLLLLLFLLFSKNSCSKKEMNPEANSNKISDSTSVKDSISLQEKKTKQQNQLTQISLPSGLKINAYPGGIEDQIVKFLQSDEYKNSTNDDLKNKWFDFDAINFEFGSGTQLTPESENQIKNIVSIIKEFPNTKIKIGAYTDKKGNSSANLKLSQQRADVIKEILIKNGLDKQVVGAEGYGDQFAKVDINASDEERAKDRRISLRFDK